MNVKEAERIVERAEYYRDEGPFITYHVEYAKAQGFLEAVEKFGPVIEILEKIAKAGTFNSYLANELKSRWHYYRRDVLGEE